MNFRLMENQEAEAVCGLVERVFRRFVAPLYEEEGVREFLGFVEPDKLLARLEEGSLVLVAEDGGELKGMIEIMGGKHVALFFVDQELQRMGLGRALFGRAREACLEREPDLPALTVNSAPNSEGAYRKLGFSPTGPAQTKNGIAFIPLELALSPGRKGRGRTTGSGMEA